VISSPKLPRKAKKILQRMARMEGVRKAMAKRTFETAAEATERRRVERSRRRKVKKLIEGR